MIIIEGIDGTGKTTLAEELTKLGYEKYHLSYEEKSEEGYLRILQKDTHSLVLDRSFISELVYGPILRNFSRINCKQTKNIISQYQKATTRIIYLKSSKESLQERRKKDAEDIEMINKYYEALDSRYDRVIKIMRQYYPVIEIDTSKHNMEAVMKMLESFIQENGERE